MRDEKKDARAEDAVPGSVRKADDAGGAFDEAVRGARDWGLRAADLVFVGATLAVAFGLCLLLWFGFDVRGIPGLPDVGGVDAASDAASRDGSALPGVAWTPDAPQIDGGVTGDAVRSGDVLAGGPVAVVQSTDGFYQVLSLAEDARITVEGDPGMNVLEVSDGRVRCVESDCSNQVCVDTGWVSAPGQMVVCLPHQLTVQVVADPADAAPLV